MKQISLILILTFILTACGAQNTAPSTEDVTIEFAIMPDPPAVGESTLMITLRDADGTAIDGAVVSVHGDMDHEGMTPVEGEISDSHEGVYHVPFAWTMGGGWILNVSATLPDNRGIVTGQFETSVGAISQDSIINQTGANDDSAIQIRYESDNDPAIAGDAEITVIALGTDGLPLDDATVIFDATMPEHDMMPIQETVTNVTNGRYVIPVSWTMAGEWQVEITIMQPDGTHTTEIFEQTVVMPD